jgi:hypothetical protein
LSGVTSSKRVTSTLFITSRVGLPPNNGLMEWNSLHCKYHVRKSTLGQKMVHTCASTVYPHCSLKSIKYKTQLLRCARAVILCISMVFISSSG